MAGVASLLRSYRPELNGDDLEQVLKLGALNLFAPPYNAEHGWGFVRAKPSLDLVSAPNVVAHWSVGSGLSYPTGSFATVDSTSVQVQFYGVPQIPDNQYSCMRYRLRATASFMFPFAQTPKAWVQYANAKGRRDTTTFDYQYEVPFGRLLSVTTTSAVVETFVYRVPGIGWFPNPPAEACVGLTVTGPIATNAVDGGIGLGPCKLAINPSPGHHTVTVQLSLPIEGRVKAQILDAMGRVISVISDENLGRGDHSVSWSGVSASGARVGPGVYFVSVDASGTRTTRRFVWLGM